MNMNEVEIKTALSDLQAVALTLWGEASGEPPEGIIAVANVIRHRKQKSGWAWKTVCHARLQFSCWWLQGGKSNYERVLGTARLLLTGEDVELVSWQECLWVAEGVMAGRVRDNVKNATHYCTLDLLHSNPPSWTRGLQPVAIMKHHAFFAGVK